MDLNILDVPDILDDYTVHHHQDDVPVVPQEDEFVNKILDTLVTEGSGFSFPWI